MHSNIAYFDYAAATPLSGAVKTAMEPFFSTQFYNPSADYQPARDVRLAVDQARSSVAQTLGARPAEIVFTAGGTESNNLAIRGVLEQYKDANVVISAIEHDSVYEVARQYDYRTVPVDTAGNLDLDKLTSSIDDGTVLVSAMYANNEFGTVQDIRKVSGLVASIRQDRQKRGNKLPLLLHSDGAQASNYLDLHVHRLGIDLLSLNGGKMYGPKQSGVVFVKAGVVLKPVIFGGGQEYGLRSGTENVTGIMGFATALTEAQNMRTQETDRIWSLQKMAIELLEQKVPGIVINGSQKKRLPNNLHLTMPGQDNERIQILLDELGICVATGSACSASKAQPSRVLSAIGLSDESIRSSLRITFGRQSTEQEVDRMVDSLSHLLAQT